MIEKLTQKLQVLLSEEEVTMINRIIINEAIESDKRPVSISRFIRDIIRTEIKNKSNDIKVKPNIKKLIQKKL